MPSSTNKFPKNSFRRGFKTEAEKISTAYRKELGLKDYEPLCAFKLAEHLKLTIWTPDQVPGLSSQHLSMLKEPPGSDQWSAITLGSDNTPSTIIYNTSHSEARVQSDIMHELAHVLLEHTMGEIDTSLGLPLRKYDQTQENEAEWLGGCLQLPKPALVKYFVFKNFSIEQIAQTFKASAAMTKYRIGVSGVFAIKARLKK